MKIRTLALAPLLIALASSTAFAATDCAKDAYTMKRIQEAQAERGVRPLRLFDARKTAVGALFVEPSTGAFIDLFVCGADDDYFYVEGQVSSWVTRQGRA